MKKKGFTLIELLGVIIVLAIIALIAVPTILGVIDKAKKGALKDSAYGLIEAANLYYAQYGVSNTERFNLEEENELKYKGKVESGTVLLNSKGKVMICINDSGNAAYKNYNDNEVVVVSGKTCNVNTSETQVLLDGENTIDEYTNQELTDLVNSLQEQIEIQNEKMKNLQQQVNNKTDNTRTDEVEELISTKSDTTLVTNLSSQHSTDINRIDNNILNINNKIGTTDISSIGNGTITGAISTLNSNYKKKNLSYKSNYGNDYQSYSGSGIVTINYHSAFNNWTSGTSYLIGNIDSEYAPLYEATFLVPLYNGDNTIVMGDAVATVKTTGEVYIYVRNSGYNLKFTLTWISKK